MGFINTSRIFRTVVVNPDENTERDLVGVSS